MKMSLIGGEKHLVVVIPCTDPHHEILHPASVAFRVAMREDVDLAGVRSAGWRYVICQVALPVEARVMTVTSSSSSSVAVVGSACSRVSRLAVIPLSFFTGSASVVTMVASSSAKSHTVYDVSSSVGVDFVVLLVVGIGRDGSATAALTLKGLPSMTTWDETKSAAGYLVPL